MSERKKLADFQLTGTKEEISFSLAVLMFRGCLWETDKRYHPLDEVGKVYFLSKKCNRPCFCCGQRKRMKSVGRGRVGDIKAI